MKCDACKENISKELSTVFPAVKIIDINVKEQRLIVQMDENGPNTSQIQSLIENKLGLNTIVRGAGNLSSAVAEICGSSNYPSVIGIARFIQNESNECLIDATIDNLNDGQKYDFGISQFGDLSKEDYSSVGAEMVSLASQITPVNRTLNIKRKVNNFDIYSYIGRSLTIRLSDSKTVVAAAIVARASKIMDNVKKVCACSGKTLWQERDDNRIV